MPEPESESTQLTSPTKLAIIAVLGLILVGVMIFQFKKSATTGKRRKTENAAVDSSSESDKAKSPKTMNKAQSNQNGPSARAWPKLLMADVSDYDPFTVPAALVEEPIVAVDDEENGSTDEANAEREKEIARRQAERDRILAKLQEQGVTAVFRTSHGATATIGSRIVHEGDVLDGFRVIEIRPEGVVLEDATPP